MYADLINQPWEQARPAALLADPSCEPINILFLIIELIGADKKEMPRGSSSGSSANTQRRLR